MENKAWSFDPQKNQTEKLTDEKEKENTEHQQFEHTLNYIYF